MALPSSAEASIQQIVALWQQAERQVRDRLAALAAEYPQGSRSAVNLTQMLGVIEQHLDAATGATKDFYEQQLPTIYMAGASNAVSYGLDFDPTMVSTGTVERLASSGWDDLLKATAHVEATTKTALRRIVANEAGASVLAGEPGATASRAGERAARDVDQIATVRYSNGAVHSSADYVDSALRTTVMNVFNSASFDMARANNVGFLEVFDGADCGWDGHDDGDLADGSIRPVDECEETPLSHPRCARSFAPRPDVTSKADAEANARYSPDEQQARAEAERERAATGQNVVGRSLTVQSQEQRAAARTARTPRAPRSSQRQARQPRT